MAKDPAFLFYSSDFLTGVMVMSFEDRGKYITLLALMHQQGRMDEETIRLLVGSCSVKLISKFKKDENGFFYNERLELETEKRNKFTQSRKDNGFKGGRPTKKNKPKPNLPKTDRLHVGYPKDNLMEDRDINENIIKKENKIEFEAWPTFEDFWNEYDKKVGKVDKIKSKWLTLSQSIKENIMQHVPNYKASQPDKKYRKNPETYLNNESWLSY